ncbi:hypothetical protein AK88_04936 [Plasmodium fragile]|uniref:Schizont-infected cell agglutination extracellular alpha domain-containing protein n=1 Tax=Plasmodium fragile TaxID=5857 RepID=A0A0D9QEJ9_PLAFR|nr:uncharacterized protein AK88_04936 [Plasmodium fragile]KJP85433.1 hypothetical protein AK88_04936 [Plasmodium fragile]
MSAELAHILAQYVKDRGLVGNDGGYQVSLDKDIADMLGEFIQHMETKESLMEDLGSNCNNEGWFHPRGGENTRHVGYTVGDKVVCKLMATALWFLSTSTHVQRTQDSSQLNNVRLKEYVKCAIVTMFASILEQSACGGTWPIHNAWKVMNRMWASGIQGLSIDGGCKKLLEIDIQRGTWSMKETIKNWLKKNTRLRKKISGEKLANKCNKVVGQGEKAGVQGTKEQLGDVHGKEEAAIMKQLQRGTKNIVKLVTKQFRGRIGGATGNSLDQTAEDSEQDDEDDEDEDDEDDDDDDKDEDAQEDAANDTKPAEAAGADPHGEQPSAPSPAGASGVGTGTPSGQPRSDGAAGENRVTAAPVPVPQPPPAAPPQREDGQGPKEEPKDKNTSAGKQDGPSCVTTINDKKVHRTDFHDNNVGIQLTFTDTSPSSGCSGSSTPGSESDENKERQKKKKNNNETTLSAESGRETTESEQPNVE